jgi:hypothetical protein
MVTGAGPSQSVDIQGLLSQITLLIYRRASISSADFFLEVQFALQKKAF